MERIPDHEIAPMFVRRWSSRAMNGEPVSHENLMRLFEAARWAPSSDNAQPWRFVYARRGTPHFEKLFGLLVKWNQIWAVRAGALVVVLSKKNFDEGRPSATHSYDTGAAWMSIALEASLLGMVVHGIAGFDHPRARVEVGVPDDYDVEAMIVLGNPGNVEDLPERYRAREFPNARRPVSESAFEGMFPQT